MYYPPLTAVDETQLIRKYRRFIFRAVNTFCVKTGITRSHPLYEDLIVEAQIAFIEECRKQKVDGLDLTAAQHARAKNSMHYSMRKFFWFSHNMGSYVQKSIDYERNQCFSDFETGDGNSLIENIPGYTIDDTKIDVEIFCRFLPDHLKPVLMYLLMGYRDISIAQMLSVSPKAIGKTKRRIASCYRKYLAVAI